MVAVWRIENERKKRAHLTMSLLHLLYIMKDLFRFFTQRKHKTTKFVNLVTYAF